MGPRLLTGFLLLFMSSAFAPLVNAEIGFELYSWKSGSHWHYAVFEGTGTPRGQNMAQAHRRRLRDITFLKGRIAQLPSGERLYWREDKGKGFVLPSQETIRQIEEFAASSNIKLFLPGETKDSKALKQLQSDVQEIRDAYE